MLHWTISTYWKKLDFTLYETSIKRLVWATDFLEMEKLIRVNTMVE